MNGVWRIISHALFIIIISISPQIRAVELGYYVDFILARHDNLNLVANPTQEEWVETLSGTFTASENSANLLANLIANVSMINYRNDQQQDSTFNNLNLNSTWIIDARHIEWVFLDVYTQTLINPLLTNTQGNRQNTNIFTTGPNYYWRLNARNNVNVEARYQQASYENTNQDSDRLSSALRWLLNINSALTTSVNLEHETLYYKDETLIDYIRSNLYARIENKKGRNTFVLEAGVTDLNYESRDNVIGQRYLISLQNQRTTNSDIFLSYSHNISDAATALSAVNSGALQSTTIPPANSGTDVFTQDSFNVTYNRALTSARLQINFLSTKRDYLIQNSLDTNVLRASILPTFNFSGGSSIGFELTQTITKYTNSSPFREDIDSLYRAIYSNSLSRNINVTFRVEFLSRESTVATRSYEDNRYIATLRYTFK